MSNFAITTKLNIYIPMREDIINKWGSIDALKEEAKNSEENKHALDFTTNFLEEILKKTLKTKSFSYLPLIYEVNEDLEDEFKILVAITFETTYSGLCLSNDKLIEMECNNFYEKLLNLLEREECQYQTYDSALI